MPLKREDVEILPCSNRGADIIFLKHYWMPRIRASRRMSYAVIYGGAVVGWVQVADVFGTQLMKPLQVFSVAEAIELCRGYFLDDAPANIESCALSKIVRRIPNDWFESYGEIKKIVVLYQDLDAGQKGIVYRACGFREIGTCLGARYFRLPTRGNQRGHKVLWARALHPVNGMHYDITLG